jgi:tetratricopeptide (TPR) repeat protein
MQTDPRTAFEQGRYDQALMALRTRDAAGLADADERQEHHRLRALCAFRLGELAEALQAASALTGELGPASDDPRRLPMHSVAVVAAGQLGRYDEALEHLRPMQSLAARSRKLIDHVRARGSLATWLCLIGDPWAAGRVMGEIVGLFQGLSEQPALEATARNNHAEISLQVARLAHQGGDRHGAALALEDAAANLGRVREIAAQLEDRRLTGFADVHESEIALLQGDPARACRLLEPALVGADSAGLWGHARHLRLLLARALLDLGDVAAAAAHLGPIELAPDGGHEVDVHVRLASSRHRLAAALGDTAMALQHLEQAQQLERQRAYRQQRAQSEYLRARLELEHLHAWRGTTPSR